MKTKKNYVIVPLDPAVPFTARMVTLRQTKNPTNSNGNSNSNRNDHESGDDHEQETEEEEEVDLKLPLHLYLMQHRIVRLAYITINRYPYPNDFGSTADHHQRSSLPSSSILLHATDLVATPSSLDHGRNYRGGAIHLLPLLWQTQAQLKAYLHDHFLHLTVHVDLFYRASDGPTTNIRSCSSFEREQNECNDTSSFVRQTQLVATTVRCLDIRERLFS
jgi:hypothetical protein